MDACIEEFFLRQEDKEEEYGSSKGWRAYLVNEKLTSH
jgi:hypothetical protein